MNDKDADLVKIMTFKSGKFVFSRRFESDKLTVPLMRANMLRATVQDLPILPNLAATLEEEVIRRSIFGTAAIEGNPLREEEVAKIVTGADKHESMERATQEIRNLKKAYDYLAETEVDVDTAFLLDESRIKEIHSIITSGIIDEKSVPGQYRNHRVKVGDESHGGVYTPPKVLQDIQTLMTQFIEWINSPDVTSLSPMTRAALAHYHLGLIHPFGDGNGRTCRVIEALLMKSSGLTYVPVMLSNYYYTHIDDYFQAFSITRKNKEHDVTHFLEFVLQGVIGSLVEIKDRIIFLIRKFTLRDYYRYLRDNMGLNKRHYDFLNLLLDYPDPFSFNDLYSIVMFRMLYEGVSPRTAKRDLAKMCDLRLLICETDAYRLNFRVLG
jgi:Fic family protein